MDEITCESIDRLISVEIRFGSGLPRGVIAPLYQAARRHSGHPLTYVAANALRSRLRKDNRILIATGAGAPPWLPRGETDGPLGAAAIARALELAIGVKPILISEERNLGPIAAAVEAAGLAVVDEETFAARNACAMVVPCPLGDAAGKDFAQEIILAHGPSAVIFVERTGPNEAGVFHSISGSSRAADSVANLQHLATRARAEGILTIGIGDGGNEIGCGMIASAVREIQPFGLTCRCPCQKGVATVTETDLLVFCAVSNWGAYGIVAALAALLGDRSILHDAECEKRMLGECVRHGAMDGAYARLAHAVDGVSAVSNIAMLTLLKEIVDLSLTTYARGF
jgi:hypothetical protein